MVAGGFESARQAAEHTPPTVMDGGQLAVHDLAGSAYGPAVGLADALVPEADA